ncbi:hypothetical protein KIW84_042043 [Lathyrus oleraceus]|uniref:CCHC-type domain-containing protein n=1 Tax=Pisum sativum TaxID=3888 RepID=A0A9D5ASV9_PEA|nr:hypothetical protein KIW84_042043 [Pisum sativum]
MELNKDESEKQVKTLALNSFEISSQTKKLKEATHDETSDEEFDDDELAFIIIIFRQLARRKIIFSSKIDNFKGSRSGSKDRDGCFNCNKPSHFIVECLDLHRDKRKKENFQKNNFKGKFNKSLMETWEELDNEGEDEKANLALMALILSDSKFEVGFDSKSENTTHVLSKLSISDLGALCHDFMERYSFTTAFSNKHIDSKGPSTFEQS